MGQGGVGGGYFALGGAAIDWTLVGHRFLSGMTTGLLLSLIGTVIPREILNRTYDIYVYLQEDSWRQPALAQVIISLVITVAIFGAWIMSERIFRVMTNHIRQN